MVHVHTTLQRCQAVAANSARALGITTSFICSARDGGGKWSLGVQCWFICCVCAQSCMSDEHRGGAHIAIGQPLGCPHSFAQITTSGPSHWRDCHFADALSPSPLKRLLKVEEGGCSRMTVSPTAICADNLPQPLEDRRDVGEGHVCTRELIADKDSYPPSAMLSVFTARRNLLFRVAVWGHGNPNSTPDHKSDSFAHDL